jgi:hypothetical protein
MVSYNPLYAFLLLWKHILMILYLSFILLFCISDLGLTRVIKFVSDLWQDGGFLWVLRISSPIKLTQYNWHIVENGVKHHNSNQTKRLQEYLWLSGTTVILIQTFREFIFWTRYRTFLRPVFTFITFPLKAEKCTQHRINFS